jgi:hypothetical protein
MEEATGNATICLEVATALALDAFAADDDCFGLARSLALTNVATTMISTIPALAIRPSREEEYDLFFMRADRKEVIE